VSFAEILDIFKNGGNDRGNLALGIATINAKRQTQWKVSR